jgi:hypothetical protein
MAERNFIYVSLYKIVFFKQNFLFVRKIFQIIQTERKMSSYSNQQEIELLSIEARIVIPSVVESSNDSTEKNANESVTNNETPTIVPAGPQVEEWLS